MGGRAANFMDLTGNALHEQMNAGLVLLNGDPNVKVIFVNIYGGMVDCYKVVTSVMFCHKMGDLEKQVVLRLKGLNSDMVKGTIKLP